MFGWIPLVLLTGPVLADHPITTDGKVMTSESTTGPIKSRSVFDRVN